MQRRSLYFTGQNSVQIRDEMLPVLSKNQAQFSSLVSLISAGTEMLFFRGELSCDLPMKKVLPSRDGQLEYPLKFGYSLVGQLNEDYRGKVSYSKGQRFFAFNSHESAFAMVPKKQFFVPEDCSAEDAIFLANMETALNIILDAQPRIGERVVVIGLGVLGLLTSALLREHPLHSLFALDPFPLRQKAARELGLENTFDSQQSDQLLHLQEKLGKHGADTVIELSGHPEALNLAMKLVGSQGKILVGSWYGARLAELDLGSHFHQGRIQIISSQVANLNPELKGRWNRKRRFALAWDWIRRIKPSRWITSTFSLEEAGLAYDLIDSHPEKNIALALKYD